MPNASAPTLSARAKKPPSTLTCVPCARRAPIFWSRNAWASTAVVTRLSSQAKGRSFGSIDVKSSSMPCAFIASIPATTTLRGKAVQ